ncbi:secreted RxLR effector protein 161-like [Gastrolobium bilobum]|uniref:secreted RxLR effector protein 161-like n=1 Tax=Gastrolobium bilobum TaxID=150636 RepID=UPI002AB02562|nr:secreted RxLR effector protein 161-like [Gastrolobium bilobum]
MLKKEFEMKFLGPAKRILGMEITRTMEDRHLSLSQSEYVKKVIRIFEMHLSKLVSTPLGAHFRLKSVSGELSPEETQYMSFVPYSNVVGCLMYAMIGTRPDIAYGVSMISRFMSKPCKEHWSAVKWLLRYFNGSINCCLNFSAFDSNDFNIVGYCDSDYATDLDKRRSLTGFVFTVGGNVVSCKCNLQHIVALSTTEDEYVVLTKAVKEAIWLKAEVGLLYIKKHIQNVNFLV